MFFEVVTTNGFRRSINPDYVVTVGELKNNGRSNTVINLTNGENIFVDDRYEEVMAAYMLASK